MNEEVAKNVPDDDSCPECGALLNDDGECPECGWSEDDETGAMVAATVAAVI